MSKGWFDPKTQRACRYCKGLTTGDVCGVCLERRADIATRILERLLVNGQIDPTEITCNTQLARSYADAMMTVLSAWPSGDTK